MAQQDQGRRRHHEQEMLRHVGGQKELVEGVEGRFEGDKDGRQTGEESQQPWSIALIMQQPPSAHPAAQVHKSQPDQQGDHSAIERPRGQRE
jgi:hypothetical protein